MRVAIPRERFLGEKVLARVTSAPRYVGGEDSEGAPRREMPRGYRKGAGLSAALGRNQGRMGEAKNGAPCDQKNGGRGVLHVVPNSSWQNDSTAS